MSRAGSISCTTMCSITALLGIEQSTESHRDACLRVFATTSPRTRLVRCCSNPSAILAHERLAIVDVASGSQPLKDPNNGNLLAVNGEIYNHRDLKRGALKDAAFTTASDCEVILPLYASHGADLVDHLEGMYAFVLHEPSTGKWLVGRDPIGIIPCTTAAMPTATPGSPLK